MSIIPFARRDLSKQGAVNRFVNQFPKGAIINWTDTTRIGVCDISGKVGSVFQVMIDYRILTINPCYLVAVANSFKTIDSNFIQWQEKDVRSEMPEHVFYCDSYY